MAYAEDDRVLIRPLGVRGTIRRIITDGRYAVMADGPGEFPVVWREDELEPAPPLHSQSSSLADD